MQGEEPVLRCDFFPVRVCYTGTPEQISKPSLSPFSPLRRVCRTQRQQDDMRLKGLCCQRMPKDAFSHWLPATVVLGTEGLAQLGEVCCAVMNPRL